MYLVLRPQGKAQATAQYLNSAGIHAYPLGIVEIIDKHADISKCQQHLSTKQTDLIIVTSTYAAAHLISTVSNININTQEQLSKRLLNTPILCIGKSCYEMLSKLFVSVHKASAQNSESLLDAPLVNTRHKVENKHIVLLKGKGGRDLINKELSQRCAFVHEFTTYERCIDYAQFDALKLVKPKIEGIIATSNEICQAILDSCEHSWLKTLTWLVVSERAKSLLASYNIHRVMLSTGAQNSALLASLNEPETLAAMETKEP